MEEYLTSFFTTVFGMANYQFRQVVFDVPWNENWFWGLTIVSVVIWMLEIAFPWRKNQSTFRKDFWLDGAYMYLNFFAFQIGLYGIYSVFGLFFEKIGLTMTSIAIFEKDTLPLGLFIILFFVLNDFVQWLTHIMLHKSPLLWNFHKVHHSVQEMGFAAHLRYHWMENVLYKPLKTLAVMVIIGGEPEHAFFIHFFTVIIGHLNHTNIKITWGPLKYLFNNPVMHLWHHSKDLPEGKNQGVNFGISLSLWDYVFKTAYVPEDSGTIQLGFDGIEEYPTSNFFSQLVSGFGKK